MQEIVWDENGPDYRAPYAEVLAALTRLIVEHYRTTMWDPYTVFRHLWYFARVVGLHAWAKREAASWLPFRPTFTLVQFNKMVLAGRLKRNTGNALADPALMSYWIERAYEEGGQVFSAEVTTGLRQKTPEISVIHRTLALLWDRHTPPLEFWEYPPMAAMFEYILHSKGLLSVTMNEEQLRKIVSRLGLTKSEHAVVRWSHREGPGILYFDVDAAHSFGLPSGSES